MEKDFFWFDIKVLGIGGSYYLHLPKMFIWRNGMKLTIGIHPKAIVVIPIKAHKIKFREVKKWIKEKQKRKQ